MRIAVVDIQSFTINNNQYVPKEMAIRMGSTLNYFLFKPPQSYHSLDASSRKTVHYVEQRCHGLRFSSGYVEYEDLNMVLEKNLNVDFIYVRGQEKYNFLVNKLSELSIPATVVNIEAYDGDTSYNTPKFYATTPACMNHLQKSAICAINNCDVIYQWMLNDILPH